MEQVKWTARKFTFGYDKGYVPFFLERLKNTAPRLDELFSNTDEVAAARKLGGSWSAKEHLGHLSDLELLHDGRIDDFIAGVPKLRAADMQNNKTYAADHNRASLPTLLKHFREGRNNLIDRVRTLDDRYFEKAALHPRLQQQVTLTDILFFIAEHDNHHLLRIAEAL